MASEQPVTNVVLHDHYYHPWMVIHVVIIKIYYLDYIIKYYYPNHPWMTSIVIVSQPAGSNYVQVTTWLGQLPCRALGCVANIVDGNLFPLDISNSQPAHWSFVGPRYGLGECRGERLWGTYGPPVPNQHQCLICLAQGVGKLHRSRADLRRTAGTFGKHCTMGRMAFKDCIMVWWVIQ